MKLRDIIEPITKLLDDAHAAETHLEQNDSQFARRAYVRSVFSSLEGIIWLLKQVCLTLQSASSSRIDPAEFALLQDQSYDLKNNGETSVQTKFLRTSDNLRFTFRVVNRLFGGHIDLGVGAEPWDAFLGALAIRHRITHPKKVDELTIADQELQVCRNVSSWFNEIILAAIKSILAASEQAHPCV